MDPLGLGDHRGQLRAGEDALQRRTDLRLPRGAQGVAPPRVHRLAGAAEQARAVIGVGAVLRRGGGLQQLRADEVELEVPVAVSQAELAQRHIVGRLQVDAELCGHDVRRSVLDHAMGPLVERAIEYLRFGDPHLPTAFVTGAVAWLALERPDDRPILEPVRDPHPHELAAARRRREPHLDGERLIWGKPAAEALAPLGQRLSGLPAGDLHLCLELVEPPGWGCIVAEATAGLAEPCVVRTGVIAWRGNMEQLGIGAKGREQAGEHASLPVAPSREALEDQAHSHRTLFVGLRIASGHYEPPAR